MTADTGETMVTALVASRGIKLRRFFLSRARNNADVPDLIEEVCLRMLRIPDHDTIRSPEAYLFDHPAILAWSRAMHRDSLRNGRAG